MGTLSRLRNREDNSFNNEDDSLEEQYQKLFKKIARDFITYEEAMGMVGSSLAEVYKELGWDISTLNAARDIAIVKAIEYKENLSKQKTKRTKYKDIADE